jgi:hypothetical protein
MAWYLHSIDSGEIKTPNVVITAEDNSFVLRSGETFKPPFQSKYFYINDALQGLANKWRESFQKERGARRVRVQCGDDHFYGILAFNGHYSHDKKDLAPNSYKYKIEIPEQYIAAAKNGGRSVVYELVPLVSQGMEIGKEINWILWLSDEPFE